MRYSRRDFNRIALAGLPATFLFDSDAAVALAQGKPNSTWAGVQVGMNVPYNFKTGNYMTAEDIIARCQQLGVSGMELRAQPIELFLGSPAAVAAAAAAGNRGRGAGGRGAGRQGAAESAPSAGGAQSTTPQAGAGERGRRGGGRAPLTPEQQAAQRAAAEETRKWRSGVSLDKVREFGRKFDNAGIGLQVIKWDGIFNMSDEEVDYCFQVSKAVGASALSTEISIEETKRIGQFADKHKMPIGYHGHATTSAAEFETVLSYAKHNAVNLDIGHYIAGQNDSPVPFLRKHHDRITHIHVKDRKRNNGPNVPLGQGDTPIKEVLQLMRDNKWRFQATLEFEYPVPEGSDVNTELARCMEYCKACLLA
jgi:sugar phosphate isomerase/epimerase